MAKRKMTKVQITISKTLYKVGSMCRMFELFSVLIGEINLRNAVLEAQKGPYNAFKIP
jgi:hypothetical protein